MKNSTLILTETIESLGLIGSEVSVAKGYARNFLLPQKKAIPATRENRKLMEKEKTKVEHQIAREKAQSEEFAARIQGVRCTIPAKVSDAERLYGSVGVRDIMDALAIQGINIQKNAVLLTEPIKMIGSYEVPIRVYKEVEPVITVEVVPED